MMRTDAVHRLDRGFDPVDIRVDFIECDSSGFWYNFHSTINLDLLKNGFVQFVDVH